jgi:hypothetical protein
VVGPINAFHMERVALYRFVIGRSLGLALGSCISKGVLEGRHKSPYYQLSVAFSLYTEFLAIIHFLGLYCIGLATFPFYF